MEAIDAQLALLMDERARAFQRWREQEPNPNTSASLRQEPPATAQPSLLSAAGRMAIFRELDSACLALLEPVRIAYLGPAGTFTHAATKLAFGSSLSLLPTTSIAQVFETVARGEAHHGVVPIENSTEGSVRDSLDRLLETGLRIEREVLLSIRQCLLSQANRLSGITEVASHPQALAQCRDWIGRQLPQARVVPTESTTAAVVRARQDASRAAIGSELAGALHEVPVLRAGIQDQARNVTRFAVIGRQQLPPSGHDKTSVVFSTRHQRGALSGVLDVFDQHGLNLTRIESRPSREQLWEYVFFVDFEGHRADPQVTRALERLSELTGELRWMGSYPRAELQEDT